MSDYMWEEPSSAFYGFGACPTLVATVTDDVDAELYVECQDGVRVTLAVRGDGVRGGYASTDKTADCSSRARSGPNRFTLACAARLSGPRTRRWPTPSLTQSVGGRMRWWPKPPQSSATCDLGARAPWLSLSPMVG